MRIKFLIPAACALALSSVAYAAVSDVNAQQFYANAIALESKGMAAIFDGRVKPMMAQMKDAATRVRAENDAATAAGHPLYCRPQGKTGIGSSEAIAMIGAILENERRTMTLAQAWKRALVRKFPCS